MLSERGGVSTPISTAIFDKQEGFCCELVVPHLKTNWCMKRGRTGLARELWNDWHLAVLNANTNILERWTNDLTVSLGQDTGFVSAAWVM